LQKKSINKRVSGLFFWPAKHQKYPVVLCTWQVKHRSQTAEQAKGLVIHRA